MGSILLFAVSAYGLVFLLADATILGCSTTKWNDYHKNPSPEEEHAIRTAGIIPLRQQLLKVNFFRKLLSCYFCMGVYSGVAVHWAFLWFASKNPSFRDSYILWGTFEPVTVVIGTIVAACAGGTVCYSIDRFLIYLETRSVL